MQILEYNASTLLTLGTIPCRYLVSERLDCSALPQWKTTPEPERWKDYDSLPANKPIDLLARHDASSWKVVLLSGAEAIIGGALLTPDALAYGMPTAEPGRAAIVDLRIAPDHRGLGHGKRLLETVCQLSESLGSLSILIETQDTNVPACRLYHSCGFNLRLVDPNAYPPELSETMMLWERKFL